MKGMFRFVGLSMLLAVVFGAGATAGFAQAECDNFDLSNELDAKIRENYQKWDNAEAMKVAADAGKQYLEKFGTCEAFKDFVDWVKPQVPKWEERVKFLEGAGWLKPRFARFDASLKGAQPNFADAYGAGGEILQKFPVGQVDPVTKFSSIDQAVTLGLLGLDASYAKQAQFQDQALRYAQAALDYLKADGKAQRPDGKFGVIRYDLSREDAISSLTYTIGHIKFFDKKDRKGALANFYDVTQIPGMYKNRPVVYASIGDYYREEAAKITDEIKVLIKQIDTAPTDEEKLKIDAQIKAKEALFNGYAERAMDAYGRAHKLAGAATPEEKKYKDSLYTILSGLYELRFQKKDGLDTWVAATVAKPMPNPTTEVQPVADADANATTGGATAVNRP